MGRHKQSNQKQTQTHNTGIWSSTVAVAIISTIGLIVVALINRSTAITTTLKPIEATQTAEARLTLAANLQSTQYALNTEQAVALTQLATTPTVPPLTVIVISATPDANLANTATALARQTGNLSRTQTALSSASITLTNTPLPPEKKAVFTLELYTVKDGDTYEAVSRHFTGTTKSVKAIKSANEIDILRTGDRLLVPVYIIQAGDTVYIIRVLC